MGIKISKKEAKKFYLLLLSLILPLSDWLIETNLSFIKFGISISDLIIVAIVTYNFFNGYEVRNITKNRIAITSTLIVVLNIVFHYFFNPDFKAISSLGVIVKYFIYLVFLHQNMIIFIKSFNKEMLFKYLMISAIVVILLDFYIRIAIGKDLPFKFLWYFTRSDENSYIYRGTGLTRSKSIFSEPSYYGQFLNIMLVLLINQYNEVKEKRLLILMFVIMLSIYLTYSLSAYFLAVTIALVMLLKFIKDNNINYKRLLICSIFIIVFFIFLSVVNYSTFERVILRRIKQIIIVGDLSAKSRLFGSWSYSKNYLFGNGFGQTPPIWNNLAYVYSDFGIIMLMLYLVFFFIKLESTAIYLLFVSFHFTKGGYVSSFNLMFIMIFIVFFQKKMEEQ